MLVNGAAALSILAALLVVVLVSRARERRAFEMRGGGSVDGSDGVKLTNGSSGKVSKPRRRVRRVADVAEVEEDDRYHAYR